MLQDMISALPTIRLIYFSGSNSFVRTYPFLPDECHGYTDWSGVDWFATADEINDPTRSIVYTDLYQDPYTHEWMISCLAPVYRHISQGGEYLDGVIGIDTITNSIISTVSAVQVPWNGYLMLVSRSGLVVGISDYAASDWGMGTNGTTDNATVDITQRGDRVSKAINDALQSGEKQGTKSCGNSLISWYSMDVALTMVLVLPEQPLHKFRQTALEVSLPTGLGALLLLSLGVAGIVLWLWLQVRNITNGITTPLGAVERALRHVGRGDFQTSEDELPHSPIRELCNTTHVVMEISEQLKTTIDRISSMKNASEVFVPKNFIDLLSKPDLTQLSLNDCCTWPVMSVLFVDIRGFVALTEHMDLRSMFEFLNYYLGKLVPVITKNNGFVDKYIGDGMMALFPRSPEDCARATLSIFDAVAQYNTTRGSFPAISIGVGVATGPVLIGTVGVAKRLDVTVLGDVVNISSRLEALTRGFNCNALISGTCVGRCPPSIRRLTRYVGGIFLKGKGDVTQVYEMVAADDPQGETKLANAEALALAISRFAARDLQGCLDKVRHMAAAEDPVAQVYEKRCLQFLTGGVPKSMADGDLYIVCDDKTSI
eukprot:TRINITY_DN2318_c0_g1_i3.p1 TRINITY_DN2318_c0_g1~~TRINITY_DN2318_c0_g1_i3.p1  ORF type:complete len:599 (+),score=87.02 TRINITY_DN2318_c0_g1_i3:353-2149(+)